MGKVIQVHTIDTSTAERLVDHRSRPMEVESNMPEDVFATHMKYTFLS